MKKFTFDERKVVVLPKSTIIEKQILNTNNTFVAYKMPHSKQVIVEYQNKPADSLIYGIIWEEYEEEN